VPDTHEVTRLLQQWAAGNSQARDQLIPLVYVELRRLAAHYLRAERPDHSLQPTALVHEAYLRLVHHQNPTFQNRSSFFGIAAHLMREILVDHAKRQKAGKRAGRKVPLDEALSLARERPKVLLALDDALTELKRLDERKCQTVELRFFGGLRIKEIAQTLRVSTVTVGRDLRMAEAWLYREMSKRTPPSPTRCKLTELGGKVRQPSPPHR
jgi:RNA polymerase sigma-70 factor, ECF subfamily